MEVKKFADLDLYLKGFEIEAIGNKAIKDVQAENKKKGIPLVYSVDGKIYYELADGTITVTSPFDEYRLYYTTNIKNFMEEKLVEIKASGIKCDNPNCDFYDETVTWDNVDATIEKWLNVKCPLCGEILLTESDAALVKNVANLANMLNKLDTAELKRYSDHIDNDTIDVTLKMENGHITISKKEADDTKETI